MKPDNNHSEQLKGMIPFACRCGEKVLVFTGAAGRTSNKCPGCHQMSIFDFDRMTAIPSRPFRGAVHKFMSA